MPVESGPSGLAWSQALLAEKAELFFHALAPGQAPRQARPISGLPGAGFPAQAPLGASYPAWPGRGTLGDPAEMKAQPGR